MEAKKKGLLSEDEDSPFFSSCWEGGLFVVGKTSTSIKEIKSCEDEARCLILIYKIFIRAILSLVQCLMVTGDLCCNYRTSPLIILVICHMITHTPCDHT